jgi:hypothetical protein
VDQVFAAKAEPNMADGSFNPVLSLQQATHYEATREAADLDRRLERGLVRSMLLRDSIKACPRHCCSTWYECSEQESKDHLGRKLHKIAKGCCSADSAALCLCLVM